MARKLPIRTCIACGASSDKRGLVRVVRTPEGAVELDITGKAAGRGAYVCRSEECFGKARKKRLFASKLRCKVSEQDYERLSDEFNVLLEGAGLHGRDGE